jgi:hypothetical protein
MMMISNKNIFVSFLFSSAILIGLGPNNLGITSSSSSSSSSFVVNADITCNTELDFHTWENEKEQRNIPGKQTFEQIATILLETFDEAYSGSNARMISDTFASVRCCCCYCLSSCVCCCFDGNIDTCCCCCCCCCWWWWCRLLPKTLTSTHNTISVPSSVFFLIPFFIPFSFPFLF